MTLFNHCPEEVTLLHSLQSVSAETGASYAARATIDLETRAWQLSWSHASRQCVDDLLAIANETGCGAETFEWAPPGETTTNVEFVEQSLRFRESSLDRFTLSVQFEEVT